MNNELLIEALEIAINNYEYDNEFDKADTLRAYIQDTRKEMERSGY